jgi:hypothetical protein
MLNPHIPSRNEENAQKLKENEFLPVMRAARNRGVKIIGSIKPVDADRLLQIIEEGGGTPQIKSAIKFINIRPR